MCHLWIESQFYPNLSGEGVTVKATYFFMFASLQDSIRRFKYVHGNFNDFPDKAALQLNDIHPSILIAKLMRMLLDEEHLGWERSWNIVSKIMYEINHAFIKEFKKKTGHDYACLSWMSIVEEGVVKQSGSVETQGDSSSTCHISSVSAHPFSTVGTNAGA
ncbi:glycogen phosphorylase 1-like protein [Tanacetum coccineum]